MNQAHNDYTVSRNMRGELQGESIIPIDIEGVGSRHLKVLTYKGSRGLQTSATVVKFGDDGASCSFAMFSDFSKTIATSNARATEKNVGAVHSSALEGIGAVIESAKAHYAPGSKWAEQQARDARHRAGMKANPAAAEAFADPMHY